MVPLLLQEDQEAKAEEEMFPDAAAVERKRAQEAEKWRLQQLKEGTAAEDNANFQVSVWTDLSALQTSVCQRLRSLA